MLKNKKLIIILCCVVAVFAICTVLALIENPHIEITVLGEKEITLEYGDEFSDSGADAKLCGNIFLRKGKEIKEIETVSDVDISKLGQYTVKYMAKSLGKTGEVIRTVKVVDTKLPSLTLTGDAEVSVTKGAKYEDKGATANDNYDGDITNSIQVEGLVDTEKAGEYTLTYTISDSSGNSAKLTRKVTVKEPPKKQTVSPSDKVTVNPGPKVVYLTFDDGPGPYTKKLLDVLNKYNVKATFFVTNNNPNYNYLFKEMVAGGHAIAIHTATHNYKKIYASEDAFFADVYKMQDIIKQQTGVTTHLLRFPGGSSNMVSSFNRGIMSRLSKSVTEKGFRYFDWNVTSGDAGETTSTAQVAKNVINGMASHSVSVVLQHDIKNFSVNAVEQIIQWGKANGYTFKVCDMTSPTTHHGINN